MSTKIIHAPTKMTRSRSSLLPNQMFPKTIRDQLRMTVALRGHSSLRQGEGMSGKKQEQCLENFYHGVPNKSPSQIQMISEGLSPCDDLHETKTVSIVTSKSSGKKNKKKVKKFLKEKLSRDLNCRHFFAGDQITLSDLEKKNRRDLL